MRARDSLSAVLAEVDDLELRATSAEAVLATLGWTYVDRAWVKGEQRADGALLTLLRSQVEEAERARREDFRARADTLLTRIRIALRDGKRWEALDLEELLREASR